MKLIQPKFWYKTTLLTYILYPLSLIYFLFSLFLNFFKGEKKMSIPVICVGNLVVGGSGKTPTCIAIKKSLTPYFKKSFILTKGYKGYQKKSHLVKKNDTYRKVGDDALIHSKYGSVCVAKNRVKGADFCVENSADLIILDDGLQSKHICKDLSFIVVDGKQKFGNKKFLPAGPLREPLSFGLKKYTAIILIDYKKKDFIKEFNPKIPIILAKKKIQLGKIKKNVFAFCGIGFPENFFDGLREKGLNIVRFKIYSDHHFYKKKEIDSILEIANQENLDIVTTEKDHIKLIDEHQKKIKYTQVKIEFENKKKLLSFFNQI